MNTLLMDKKGDFIERSPVVLPRCGVVWAQAGEVLEQDHKIGVHLLHVTYPPCPLLRKPGWHLGLCGERREGVRRHCLEAHWTCRLRPLKGRFLARGENGKLSAVLHAG